MKTGTERSVEFARFLVVDASPDQVSGNKIGRELDALELAANRIRQGLDRHGLCQPGHTFHQDMSARQQGHHQPFQQMVLSDNDLFDLVQHTFHWLAVF